MHHIWCNMNLKQPFSALIKKSLKLVFRRGHMMKYRIALSTFLAAVIFHMSDLAKNSQMGLSEHSNRVALRCIYFLYFRTKP